LLPPFHFLKEAGRILVRLGLTQELQAVPKLRSHIPYTLVLRRTYAEYFLWVESDWEEYGVRLVVLHENMLRRILSGEGKGLTRDHDTEDQSKGAVETSEIPGEGELDEHTNLDLKAVMDHISVWKGKLEDVMRAVLEGDEARKLGLREYNFVLDEWLGEDISVGNDGRPISDNY
jgi:hypothetical protein